MTTDTGPSNNQAYLGNQSPASSSSEFNTLSFMIQGALTKIRTAHPVTVVACTNSGGLSAAGTVDVKPLVNQIDGYGNPTPHGTIYKRPYLRWQGGTNAIIMDPVAGDIGLLVCCDRDTSAILNTMAAANPGSMRSFDFADGFYIAAIGNGTPSNFVQFTGGNINVTSPGVITLTGSSIVLDGPVTGNSTATFSGDVVGSGTSLHSHVHSGVTTGGANTGAPV